MQSDKVSQVINHLIDMPNHKIKYMICNLSLVQGLRDNFSHYGVAYNKEVHELLVEAVQEKLEDSDIEREWSEVEYNTFVKFD